MAVNIVLEKLEQGKALCGMNFPGFVKTFNWLVDFCCNLKGDADVDALNGRVTVDTADEAHPIIRFNASGFSTGGGGGGGSCDCPTYVAGDDTNIVFTESTDTDGKTIKVDVYYK